MKSNLPPLDFTPAREGVLDAHLALRFSGALKDAYRLRYVPAADARGRRVPGAFATACWLWQADPTEPHHVITFGEALADNLKLPSAERLSAYAVRYYRHEKAHSLYTERNLKALSEACERDKVPFRLVNLLEDARIEHLERTASGLRFDWTDFEGKNTGASPDSYFLAIIQADGVAGDAQLKVGKEFKDEQAARVRDYYYPAATRCPTTWAILKLAREWIKEFGQPEGGGDGASEGGGGGSGAPSGGGKGKGKMKGKGCAGINPDMVAALEAQMNAAIQQALAECADLGAKPGDKPETDKTFGMGEENSVQVAECSTADMLTGATNLNLALVESLFAQAMTAFPKTRTKITSLSPSKRLCMRNVVRDLDRVYRKTVEGDTIMPSQVVFMLDCSSSMNAASGQERLSAHDLGCVTLAVLSRLARQGVVKGHAVLTAGVNRVARCQTFPLPMTDDQIGRIFSSGQFEGFDSAMRVCQSILKQADLVLAYTDGRITDHPVQKRFWHQHGIYSVGMYCGSSRLSSGLGKWFDTALSRETPEGLIDALAQILRKWARGRTAA